MDSSECSITEKVSAVIEDTPIDDDVSLFDDTPGLDQDSVHGRY